MSPDMPTTVRFQELSLAADPSVLPELAAFYVDRLGLPTRAGGDGLAFDIAGTVVRFSAAAAGAPFYHLALLVPGDRFAAARDWLAERAELLPDPETGETTFDFSFWDAEACYCHDPAGTILELIAHRPLARTGKTGPFDASELLGLSEVGLVVPDIAAAAAALAPLGLPVWDGTVDDPPRLAFAGARARTLILAAPGRPWLPTGRPAEEHPLRVVVEGAAGEVEVGACVVVSRPGASSSGPHPQPEP